MMGLTPIQYTKQTENDFFRNNFQKFRYPVFSYTHMAFNLKHPWFKDKRIRQAIAYGIDKAEIVDVVLFGLGRPATAPMCRIPGLIIRMLRDMNITLKRQGNC